MPYNRKSTIAYAKKYWDRPCADGLVCLFTDKINIEKQRKLKHAPLKDGWEALFVSDGQGAEKLVFQRPGPPSDKNIIDVHGWKGLADCAHFLSQCLSAGGLAIHETGATEIINKISKLAGAKVVAHNVDQAGGQRVIDSGIFQIGDVIGYTNIAKSTKSIIVYEHSAMYVGKTKKKSSGTIACHTACRYGGLTTFFDDGWDIADHKYTLIHLSYDDSPPSPQTALQLQGWWGVSAATGWLGKALGSLAGNSITYYHADGLGRAHKTTVKPKNANARPALADSGYWFQVKETIVFIWPQNGYVDVWTAETKAPDRAASYLVKKNGGGHYKANKLFR